MLMSGKDFHPSPAGAPYTGTSLGLHATIGDGVDAPRRHRCAKVEVLNTT